MPRKRDFWKNQVTAFLQSNLTQAEYCRQNSINANYLSKLVRMKRQENQCKDFVQIKPITQTIFNNCLKLSLSDKYTITVPDNFSNEALRNILDVLEAKL